VPKSTTLVDLDIMHSVSNHVCQGVVIYFQFHIQKKNGLDLSKAEANINQRVTGHRKKLLHRAVSLQQQAIV